MALQSPVASQARHRGFTAAHILKGVGAGKRATTEWLLAGHNGQLIVARHSWANKVDYARISVPNFHSFQALRKIKNIIGHLSLNEKTMQKRLNIELCKMARMELGLPMAKSIIVVMIKFTERARKFPAETFASDNWKQSPLSCSRSKISTCMLQTPLRPKCLSASYYDESFVSYGPISGNVHRMTPNDLDIFLTES